MKELENSLSQLVENSDIRMLSPVTRLKAKGIQLAKPPQRTLEESIDLLFSDKRKKIALDVAQKLTFVDCVVKYLWGKINIPQNDTSSTEAQAVRPG